MTLSACGSSPTVDESENYRGRLSAAVAPVADHRVGGAVGGSGTTTTQLQRSIQQSLERAGIFAGVVALDRREEGNEAEVIIESAIMGTPTKPVLKVRIVEKSNQRTVLEGLYQGKRGGAIQAAIEDLEQDLEDKYRDRARVF